MKKITIAFLVLFDVVFSSVVAKADTFNNDLYYGVQNSSDVIQLQEFLTAQGVYTGPISGNFFSLTLSGVRSFQSKVGISPASGYFGPKTRAKANAILSQELGQSQRGALLEGATTTPLVVSGNNPVPANNLLASLLAQVQALQNQLANLQQASPSSNGTTPAPTTTPFTIPNYPSFQTVDFDIFHDNPNGYPNQNILVMGVSDGTFLPSHNGSPNYIELYDPFNSTSPKIEIAVNNQSDYGSAVQGLQPKQGGSLVIARVYGQGIASQQFALTNGTTAILPIISATRIDRCTNGYIPGTILSGSKMADVVSCSTWTPLFPSGLAPITSNPPPAQPTPPPSPAPTSTPIASPSGTQCNFNGNVFNCTSDSRISASPTSLPNAVVGASYNQPITVNDPNATSQNFRWNIISGALPSGMAFVFSPSQALTCSGTYCFFTTPPSGASYSSSNAAYLFGTPTASGTYSFTLQAIDGLNYFGLPTFTINIVNPAPAPTSSTTYTITASAGTGGTISPSGQVSVQSGANQTFTIAANPGYDLNGKVVDGAQAGGQTVGPDSYTFANVTANHTIVANFFQSALATVTVSPATASLAVGATQQLTAATRDQAGLPFAASVAWNSDNTAVATVNSNGLVTAVSPGTATIAAMSGATSTVTWIPAVITVHGTSQCNFNGNIFYCTPDTNITFSPTSLPNATSGINYGKSLTVSDPHTTSQNFRWNIIDGNFPPGIGLAFSPSQALQCSGTYCFFTAPPSGLSYPANSPGYFFGTPIATGTYNFTLQAIDALNFVTNPTFSITVN